jgi:hypothetical protein
MTFAFAFAFSSSFYSQVSFSTAEKKKDMSVERSELTDTWEDTGRSLAATPSGCRRRRGLPF